VPLNWRPLLSNIVLFFQTNFQAKCLKMCLQIFMYVNFLSKNPPLRRVLSVSPIFWAIKLFEIFGQKNFPVKYAGR
jgi:hypothetical protein